MKSEAGGLRIKQVRAQLELLAGLFKPTGRGIQCVEGLPVDAKLIRFWCDPDKDVVTFVFESTDFNVVPEGNAIPHLYCAFAAIDGVR